MINNIWIFLQDKENQAVIGWICGGIAAVASGVWAVTKYNIDKKPKSNTPNVMAQDRSISVGKDVNNSNLNIN